VTDTDADSQARVGFFTDTSVCIGCKACEVACKEWNGVPEDGLNLLGMSFDNTGGLSANSWLLPPAQPRPPAHPLLRRPLALAASRRRSSSGCRRSTYPVNQAATKDRSGATSAG
jgi:hypothetical protein